MKAVISRTTETPPKVTFTGNTATAKLSFDQYHDAESFKLFMLDNDHAPLMQHIEFSK